jgi:serine protease Do
MDDTKTNLTPEKTATAAPKASAAATHVAPKAAPSVQGSQPSAVRAKSLLVALFFLVTLGLGFLGGWLGSASQKNGTTTVTQQRTVLTSQAALISSIAKEVGPSVVSVNVTSQQTGSLVDPFFGYGGSQSQESAGTGIILTTEGLILTNRHVVPAEATSVDITLSDGTVFENVKVVGRTSERDSLDVAFLQIQDTKGKKLTAAKLGNSAAMRVGDSVVAIGNALGQFQNTVTSGIVSGYGRSVQASDGSGGSVENLDNLFQTDAAINQGNSGGPLVNLNGEVIGMNTAVASESQNIGFAIPINDITGLIDSVKTTGKLQRPYLGVVYIPLTSDVAKEFGLSTERGAYIPKSSELNGQETIIAGGPAEKAGLKQGDVITKVEGTAIGETTSLTSLLGKRKVGEKVTLTVVRDGKTITIDVALGAAPTS